MRFEEGGPLGINTHATGEALPTPLAASIDAY